MPTRVFNAWVYLYMVCFFKNTVSGYFRATVRGATNGKTLTLHLIGAGPLGFHYMVVDYLRGP